MAIKKENPEVLDEEVKIESLPNTDDIDKILEDIQNDEEDYIMHEEDIQDDEVEEYEDV